jgi:hypothetical protein
MLGHYKHLFSIASILTIFIMILGCTQPEDVAAPVSVTKIYMSPVQLPTTPDGYSYELWAVDTANNFYPIDNFLWNNYYHRFYDLDSVQMDSVFSVPYDLLNSFYEYLAVTVETNPDMYPDSAGPVMLRDTIIDPKLWPMQLVFPADYSFARITYSLETPTDKDSYSRDASGVWFAFYDYRVNTLQDTIDVSSTAAATDRKLFYDTTFWECAGVDAQLNCVQWVDVTDVVASNPSYEYDTMIVSVTPKLVDTTYWNCGGEDAYGNCVDWIDISDNFHWYDTAISPLAYDTVIYDTLMDTLAISCVVVDTNYNFVPDPLMIDTFTHISVTYDRVAFPVNFDTVDVDTFAVDPCTGNTIYVEIEPLSDYSLNLSFTSFIRRIDTLDYFSASYEETPDLTGTGWHYKGWVISPYLAPPYQPTECDELGKMTKPAWLPFTTNSYFEEPDKWPIISTGSFKSFASADYTPNEYSDNKRVPNFPGEDFIKDLPCGADDYYFADMATPLTGAGDIFITLEPDNFDRNTNFPIFLFITRYTIPPYNMVHTLTPDGSGAEQQRGAYFDMVLLAERVSDNPFGFPGINVHLVRE